MAQEIFANLPSTTVSSGGTTAPAALTQESWTVASSASFPAANSGATPPTQFRIAENDLTRQSEVMIVTNVSGTTWTVIRGAEGTTPVAHPSGFTVVQTITAGALASMVQTGGGSTIQSSTAGTVGLILKGAASQSADLQQWQNSSSTVLANVLSSGAIQSARFVQAGGVGAGLSYIGDNVSPHNYMVASAAANVVLAVRGFASQTANFQEWQNSSGTILSRIKGTDGSFTDNLSGSYFGSSLAGSGTPLVLVQPPAAGKGIVVAGAASQTANLQEWQFSSGTPAAAVTAVGRAYFTDSLSTGAATRLGVSSTSTLSVIIGGSGNEGIVIQGAASQSADLQRWQNSTVAVLAKVDSAGGVTTYSAGGTALTAQLGSATTIGLNIVGAASQTGDLTRWQNSSFATLAKVTSSGDIYGSAAFFSGSGGVSYLNSRAQIKAAGDTERALVLQAYSATTSVNLQEWQSSAGAILGKVASDGTIYGAALGALGSTGGGAGMVYSNQYLNISSTGIYTAGSSGQAGLAIVEGYQNGIGHQIILGLWQNNAGAMQVTQIASLGAAVMSFGTTSNTLTINCNASNTNIKVMIIEVGSGTG